MLDESRIKEYCNINGYSCRCFGDNAVVMTGVDTWRLTLHKSLTPKYKDRILVEHANKRGNKKGKMQFHTQRIAYDVDWIFKNIIVPHQDYNRVYQNVFDVKEKLAKRA